MNFKLVSAAVFSFLMLTSCQTKDKDTNSMDDEITVYIVNSTTNYHKRKCRYIGANENVDNMPKREAEILGFDPCFKCRP